MIEIIWYRCGIEHKNLLCIQSFILLFHLKGPKQLRWLRKLLSVFTVAYFDAGIFTSLRINPFLKRLIFLFLLARKLFFGLYVLSETGVEKVTIIDNNCIQAQNIRDNLFKWMITRFPTTFNKISNCCPAQYFQYNDSIEADILSVLNHCLLCILFYKMSSCQSSLRPKRVCVIEYPVGSPKKLLIKFAHFMQYNYTSSPVTLHIYDKKSSQKKK